MSKKLIIAGLGLLILFANTSLAQTKPAESKADKLDFKLHVINPDSRFEAAYAFDVNNDGKIDIMNGGYWYQAPTWEKHPVREITEENNYYNDFSNLPIDVDGDGWTDFVTCTWYTKRLSWIRNPGKDKSPFEEIVIDEPGNMETAIIADVNADGQPDVVPNIINGSPAWYEFKRDPAEKYSTKWIKHPLPQQMNGAGVGVGDIDGDGLRDIVGEKGWAQQTKNPDKPWVWNAEFDLIDAGIPIQVHDIDNDGDADIIWGIGHGYGLYWLEQGKTPKGKRFWILHEIDTSWSQAHVVLLGDLDGDSQKEIVTGKRYYAHNGNDPGENDPLCLYYYKFNPKARNWKRYTIHEGGKVGLGLSTELVDIDKDGDLDIIAPGKSGLYLFENLRLK